MSDPKYDKIGRADDRVIEECAELIQIISKAKRFGLYSFHPDNPVHNNKQLIFREMDDVEAAIKRYRQELMT